MAKKDGRMAALEKMIAYLDIKNQELETLFNKWGWGRVTVFLGGFIFILAAFLNSNAMGWMALILFVIAFLAISVVHRTVEKSFRKHQIWHDIKSGHLARMNLDWAKIPVSHFAPRNPAHPFEIDLDITGRHSLHQLLDISVSKEGSELLGNWLLAKKPDPAAIARRQKIIQELAALPGFRDKLLLNFRLASDDQLQGEAFLDKLYLGENTGSSVRKVLIVSAILACFNIVLYLLTWQIGLADYWMISFALYVVIYFYNQGYLSSSFNDIVFLDEELGKLQTILSFLESYPYRSGSALGEFCRPFWQGEDRPSLLLKKVNWLMSMIGLRMNPALGLILNILMPWDFYFAIRFNESKKVFAENLKNWLAVWQELEAMMALANFSWLNPEMTYPKLAKEKQAFTATEMGHPLIPAKERVNNDFAMDRHGEIVMLTGSNMSGKSTFLKTIGANMALAYAGGPVVAASMKLSPFRLFSCIRVVDSVTDGFSYFYAEVRRLKGLLQALEAPEKYPLFFLIDEIFRGTNNRERYLGSSAYIKALEGKNGMGLITTHDLDLTKLETDVDLFTNYHFREKVVDGKMLFDYKLRTGPCPTTNALIIMKMEGLPVDDVQN